FPAPQRQPQGERRRRRGRRFEKVASIHGGAPGEGGDVTIVSSRTRQQAPKRVAKPQAAVNHFLFATPTFGQSALTGQTSHIGLRALQILRPWKMRRWASMVQLSRGKRAARSFSTFFGSSCFVKPRRMERRPTWVST